MGNKEGKGVVTTFVSGTSSNVSELGGRLLHCVQWMNDGSEDSVAELKGLLKKGAPVNIVSVDEMTALHIACKRGLVRAVNELLNHGADIQAHNSWLCDTPLHVAVSSGRTEVVQLLLERGAQPNALNNYGGTPLHSAALGGFPAIVELLIKNGADLTVTASEDPFSCGFVPLRPLAFAVRKGDISCIISFLRNGDNFADFEAESLFVKLSARKVPWDLMELFVVGGLKLTSDILDLGEGSLIPKTIRDLVDGPWPLEYLCLQKIRTILHGGKNWDEVVKELPISDFHKQSLLFNNYSAISTCLYPITT